MPPAKRRQMTSGWRTNNNKPAKRRAITRLGRRPKIRRSKKASLNTHRFSRWTAATDYAVSTGTTERDVGMHFTFDEMINYNEFTNLFDRYRIDRVILKFQLLANPDSDHIINNTAAANSLNFYPKLWWIKDYDDGNADTIASLKERVGVKCRVLRPNSMISIAVKPSILSLTYRTALASGYAPRWNQWIDAVNTDVPHYGLKFCIDTNGYTNATYGFTMRLEKKIYFTMKDVR